MTRFLERQIIVAAVFALASGPLVHAAADETADQAVELVRRSLPAIREGGAEWREQHGCLSCHRGAFTAWVLHRALEAQVADFSVDPDVAADWNRWTTDWVHLVKPEQQKTAKKEATLQGANDTIAQLLLGRPLAAPLRKSNSRWVAEYRDQLLQGQNADGSWKAGGQLPAQKRPPRETKEVSTAWAAIALLDSQGQAEGPAKAQQEKAAEAVAKAHQWLGDATEGESIEWWVTRMLLERSLGDNKHAQRRRQAILAAQRDDGGWGWRMDEPSDAFGAALAVYGLLRDGQPPASEPLARAVAFLHKTQREDGTWLVHGTKKNGRNEEVETAVYWGAAWAAIAALEWLDQAS